MNKRYIDFVPVASEPKGKSARQAEVGGFDGAGAKVGSGKAGSVSVGGTKAGSASVGGTKASGIKTGGSVRTMSEVVQRTAGGRKVTKISELTVSEMFEERAERPRAGVTTGVRRGNSSVTVPQAKFVNTEKVAKRPLSKNVYTKQVVEPKEEVAAKPVKIIDKPEKDSKVGMVMAVIITIVLGAAVGTVAFLLLPK